MCVLMNELACARLMFRRAHEISLRIYDHGCCDFNNEACNPSSDGPGLSGHVRGCEIVCRRGRFVRLAVLPCQYCASGTTAPLIGIEPGPSTDAFSSRVSLTNSELFPTTTADSFRVMRPNPNLLLRKEWHWRKTLSPMYTLSSNCAQNGW